MGYWHSVHTRSGILYQSIVLGLTHNGGNYERTNITNHQANR